MMRVSGVVSFALLGFFASAGCSARSPVSSFDAPDATAPAPAPADAGPGADDASFGPTSDSPACVGLGCKRVKCAGGKTTNLSGTIYDPAGKVPLYNVIVYVPNAALAPLKEGTTCDRCGVIASGSPLVTALTDSAGHFTLKDVPVGTDVPLVMQIGKWRRKIGVKVDACTDNTVNDATLTRLPRNATEGDLPRIALVQGGADPLECLLRKIGIDDTEFTLPSGTGHVHLHQGFGGNAKYPLAQDLWSDAKALAKYDVLALACEGNEHAETKPQAAIDAIHEYAGAGGRIFASHYHYYWFKNGAPDFAGVAEFNSMLPVFGTSFLIDTTFPKGAAYGAWLKNVGAAPFGDHIELEDVRQDIGTVNPKTSQRWIYLDKTSSTVESDKYFSFNTPVAAKPEDQCGRVVFSDVHVSTTGTSGHTTDQNGQEFPAGCITTALSDQEKALEFLFFDLTACVQTDSATPEAPK